MCLDVEMTYFLLQPLLFQYFIVAYGWSYSISGCEIKNDAAVKFARQKNRLVTQRPHILLFWRFGHITAIISRYNLLSSLGWRCLNLPHKQSTYLLTQLLVPWLRCVRQKINVTLCVTALTASMSKTVVSLKLSSLLQMDSSGEEQETCIHLLKVLKLYNHWSSISFNPVKVTEETLLNVTLRIQGCVDGLISP